jgi:hypothetical protein
MGHRVKLAEAANLLRLGSLPRGTRGAHIRLLQSALHEAGYDPGLVDGVFGPRTQRALEFWIAAGRDLDDRQLRVFRPPHPNALDLSPSERYGDRYGRKPTVIVLHWPGFVGDAHRLHKVMARPTSRTSTHWGVDEVAAYQYLPHKARAWHASWANRFSIGVDICQGVLLEHERGERDIGREVEPAVNTSGRGPRRALTLDPRIARNARALVDMLCDELNIPRVCPRGPDGRVTHDHVFSEHPGFEGWSGVVGHHHVDAGKWDVAPWWSQIFDGTELGDPA